MVRSSRASTVKLPADAPLGVKTVFDFLVFRFPHVSPEEWSVRFDEGRVVADSGPMAPDDPYCPGLRMRYWREVDCEWPVRSDYRIVFEDADLLVVDKPPFLPVVPAGRYVGNCLLSLLTESRDESDLVPLHRIDKDASGLVAFSRRRATRRHFALLFRPRARKYLVKEYLAVCEMERHNFSSHARLEHHIARDPVEFHRQVVLTDKGPNAVCEVEGIGPIDYEDLISLEYSADCGASEVDRARSPASPLRLLGIRLLTGRKHQIRVQLRAFGAPILNDSIYGTAPRYAPEDLSRPMMLNSHSLAVVGYPSPDGVGKLNFEWRSSRGEKWRAMTNREL